MSDASPTPPGPNGRPAAAGSRAATPGRFVKVVPFYTADHPECAAFFATIANWKKTTPRLIVFVPPAAHAGSHEEAFRAIAATGDYPGLKFDDLPCLWLERIGEPPEIVPLSDDGSREFTKVQISKILAIVERGSRDRLPLVEIKENALAKVNPEPKQPDRPIYYAGVALVLIVVLLVLVGVYLSNLERIAAYDRGVVSSVIGVFVAGLASILTFGVLRSGGRLIFKRDNLMIELVGAAAMFIGTMWFFLDNLNRQPAGSFAMTVYLYDKSTGQMVDLPARLTMQTDPPLGDKFTDGRLTLREIPPTLRGGSYPYSLNPGNPAYRVPNPPVPPRLKLAPGSAPTIYVEPVTGPSTAPSASLGTKSRD